MAVLQQLRQRVRAPRDPVQPRRRQHRARLTAPCQRRQKARPAVVLAAGDVGELRYQRPTLGRHEGAHAGLLRFQAETALTLLGGRDPVKPGRVTFPGLPRLCHGTHSPAVGLAAMRKLIPRPFAFGLSSGVYPERPASFRQVARAAIDGHPQPLASSLPVAPSGREQRSTIFRCEGVICRSPVPVLADARAAPPPFNRRGQADHLIALWAIKRG